jgi:hypothetical protein
MSLSQPTEQITGVKKPSFRRLDVSHGTRGFADFDFS